MQPFSPILFPSVLNQCYSASIWWSPLFAVSFRFPRQPWGLREGWWQKYFFNLNQSKGTQVISMSSWGSKFFSHKIFADEAVDFALDGYGWHFSFVLHSYLINIQLFKIVKYSDLNIRMFSKTRWANTDNNLSFLMLLGYSSVGVFPPHWAYDSFSATAEHVGQPY